MRKEYISYINDLPISISLENIKDYPIHWHNSIEIIFVLEGTINVLIESENYEVYAHELEIINCDEPHRIYSNEKNKVLIFHLDFTFFEKYYDDMKNIYFYTNSSKEGAQHEEKYDVLRQYLSILACEVIQKSENFDDHIDAVLVKLLFHLINNFHYLTYENALKENVMQFQRYHRIIKYIYNNYMNKITLQDIANQEYLSSYYLCHQIKDISGTTFKDLVNNVRVDESIKLLLDTDKTISDISLDVGFSHARYYNKSFKDYYKCTPLQFRKKYHIPEEEFDSFKKVETYDLSSSLQYLSYYLEDYDRFNYTNKIIKLQTDFAYPSTELQHKWKEKINLGQAKELIKAREQGYLRAIQDAIGFKNGIVQNLFGKEMKIYFNENVRFLNWNEVEKLLEFLMDISLVPLIILNQTFEDKSSFIKLLESFILYFANIYGIEVVKLWKFQASKDLSVEYINITREIFVKYKLQNLIEDPFNVPKAINTIYDSSYMLPYIIHNFINNNSSLLTLKAFDTVEENSILNNELFFGSPGLLTLDGIKKASYYAYYLLSKLGNEVVDQGDGYIITRQDEDIQVLLYSYSDELNTLIKLEDLSKGKGSKNITERKISLSIKNLVHDYKVIKYEIGEKVGSAYDIWLRMGKPKRLGYDEWKILTKISAPNISLSFAKKTAVYNNIIKIEGYGSTLIVLQEVQKHLF
ncbi:helix-turn-helix domain-containing protein [Clostridium sp. CM028]|uniref:helix-turn-helix domain-containing protein n=1 Tax=unclassified Clostridium TaxID=2614128 RepID=UPI001C0B0035|nr:MULTISPECIES: helix-turn-helix domain-containing protein [unclassified Clostridium]MBU3091825.1 helix-turn-helix domain-containing protein [Clostridium sp. CF011]MBW9148791.1 helix-turn-helix domain-containing protein [Clostridium sp. CM028]WAG68275.1 helix-turn-helix domain-containing protein [Clostridium sp. CF011]WLC63105.1 helix-turn-helix domain-containing protein [Clostridium sp. CM028]